MEYPLRIVVYNPALKKKEIAEFISKVGNILIYHGLESGTFYNIPEKDVWKYPPAP